MNGRHQKTLAAVFRNPVSGTIVWADVEAMLKAVGCEIVEGNESRVRIVKDDVILSIHRPHPAKEAKRYQIKDVRSFLSQLGIEQ